MKLAPSPICLPLCYSLLWKGAHEKLNQDPTMKRPLMIHRFVSFLTPHPEVLEHFLTPWLHQNYHQSQFGQLFSENEPTSQELHTFYKDSSLLLEPHWQESVQRSVCYWHRSRTCAGVSQTVQKWRKYQNPPKLPQFWSLLLDTTALWFQWFYFFQKLHALEQRSELFKTLLYMSVLTQQLLQTIFMPDYYSWMFNWTIFFVSTNVREMAPFSRAERVFV